MAAPTRVVPGSDVLGDAVRRLVDAVVRTQVDPADVRAAAQAVDAVTASLSGELRSGPFSPDLGDLFGNPLSIVGGVANPLAPPVALSVGPDHVLGQAALAAGHGGMTIGLELRYLAPTPLHADLVAEAHLASVDGRKLHLVGSVRSGDTTTVEARGLFLALDQEKAAELFPHLAAG